MTSANPGRRQAVFHTLGWLNAIVWSAAIVWVAGMPLMDLKKLALADPWPSAAMGTLGQAAPSAGDAPQLALLEQGNIRSIYRCDLPGWWTTRCLPEGTPLPAGPANIDYVGMSDAIGSSTHRMPVRVTVGDAVIFERSYADAISAARNRCLVVAAAGVGLWLAVNLALSMLWKRRVKTRG